jgi:DNA gyrase subunit A
MSDNNTLPVKEDIKQILIQKEMKDCYLDYAMSVIVGRALPDVRDGMKPVHRRVLFAMHSLNNYHNKPFLKSARVVGDVIGKYHPHGDSAVYSTIVRMAQDFSLRYPLVDGQGNFGSIDGDNAAAMRYTEIRMKKMSEELLQDLEKETVDWQPNYDESLKEPKVLPTKIPNLLINGSTGIAVGMATNIPPHNLTDVITGLQHLLNNPDLTIDDLMKYIPGPDFPTGASIHGLEGIKSAYHTGRGIIQIRSTMDIETWGKDRERIVVKDLPYQVNKAKLIEKIADLVNSKTVTGISDIRDESSSEGIRVVIDLKKGEIGSVIINRLYKMTTLQTSFGIILLSISNSSPKVMNLKEMLNRFLDHRREIVIRRLIFELKKAREKAHLLDGLKTAVENIDEIVAMIKASEGPAQAKTQLIDNFTLSEKQAQAILDMRLQRLTGLERDKIIKDYNDIIKEISRLEGILGNEDKIKDIIREEFDEILEKYGDERKTELLGRSDEILLEDLIKKEEQIVTITHKGYIKRMAMDTYKTQKRGGTGVKGSSSNKEEDFFVNIFTANTHSVLLFFTNRGTVFSQKVFNLPEGTRTTKGRNIVNLLPVSSSEKIKEVICIPDENELEGKTLIFATERGIVKKTDLSAYKKIKQTGLKAIKIQDGDSLRTVRVTDGTKDVLLCSTSGKIIRFPESDCRTMGRVSQGVKGISLDPSEKIIGMEIIDDNVEILSVTEKGYGKRTMSSLYRKQSRGGKGILAMRLTDKNGIIIDIKPVSEKDDLMIITNNGQVIRTKISGISLLGRTTQGVRIIRLKDGENVVSVEKIIDPENEFEDLSEE